jgi:hypothetical protein
MFARVTLVLPEAVPVLAIPSTAVLHAPYGDSVFVIHDVKDEKSGKTVKEAQMTTVRLGATRGDFVAVTTGLEAGQMVATSGVFKLRNGSRVSLDNSPGARRAVGASSSELLRGRRAIHHRSLHRRPDPGDRLNVLILIAGAQAIRYAQRQAVPASENASVTVTTVYVGAAPI